MAHTDFGYFELNFTLFKVMLVQFQRSTVETYGFLNAPLGAQLELPAILRPAITTVCRSRKTKTHQVPWKVMLCHCSEQMSPGFFVGWHTAFTENFKYHHHSNIPELLSLDWGWILRALLDWYGRTLVSGMPLYSMVYWDSHVHNYI